MIEPSAQGAVYEHFGVTAHLDSFEGKLEVALILHDRMLGDARAIGHVSERVEISQCHIGCSPYGKKVGPATVNRIYFIKKSLIIK